VASFLIKYVNTLGNEVQRIVRDYTGQDAKRQVQGWLDCGIVLTVRRM
jgi:hypothetical protein